MASFGIARRAARSVSPSPIRASSRGFAASDLDFAAFDPSSNELQDVSALLAGKWLKPGELGTQTKEIPDPLTGKPMLRLPDPAAADLQPFVDIAKSVPKSGLHNPLKNVERYLMWGEVLHKISNEIAKPHVEQHFAKTIQRVAPKSDHQATYEVKVTNAMLKNFCGDNPRFLARGFTVPGDHAGQQSQGYRFPLGSTALIAPFNFPMEIPVLQLMGAVMMGNKVALKPASITSVVMEEYLRLLHKCGAPAEDIDCIIAGGSVFDEGFMTPAKDALRSTQFTGSSVVAEDLAVKLRGKIRIEDAGFDWKIIGPDVSDMDLVAQVSDQDAYAFSGQKCSAQSILFAHKNWEDQGFFGKLEAMAARRQLSDLTIGPVLSHTTAEIRAHMEACLSIPGAKVLFGGKELQGHSIPACYGAFEPTAVHVPIKELLKPENFEIAGKELFGPFQVVTTYEDIEDVLTLCERMENHLTAAVVSRDPDFTREVLGRTVNGTTYCGIRARTTGAPQNHWFGPSGDPRGAGIGTREAILHTWSTHREIIHDTARAPPGWVVPKAS